MAYSIKTEIVKGITPDGVKNLEGIGRHFAESSNGIKALSTSQLRKFYGEVKRIQAHGFNQTDVALLRPKLAYAAGRDKGVSKMPEFYHIMCDALDFVRDERTFDNFVKACESIVAYHKCYNKE